HTGFARDGSSDVCASDLAEQSSLAAGSVDLGCVAQALHWFDLSRFHAEVRRVLKPRGIVAFWTYADCRVDERVDVYKDRLYNDRSEERRVGKEGRSR